MRLKKPYVKIIYAGIQNNHRINIIQNDCNDNIRARLSPG